jgi:hypothetical protein
MSRVIVWSDMLSVIQAAFKPWSVHSFVPCRHLTGDSRSLFAYYPFPASTKKQYLVPIDPWTLMTPIERRRVDYLSNKPSHGPIFVHKAVPLASRQIIHLARRSSSSPYTSIGEESRTLVADQGTHKSTQQVSRTWQFMIPFPPVSKSAPRLPLPFPFMPLGHPIPENTRVTRETSSPG